MKKNKIKILLILLFINILLSCICIYNSSLNYEKIKMNDLINEESAVKISQILYEQESGIYLDKNLFEVKFLKGSNEYHVYLKSYKKDHSNIEFLDYKGYYISAENGRIIRKGEVADIYDSYYERMDELE